MADFLGVFSDANSEKQDFFDEDESAESYDYDSDSDLEDYMDARLESSVSSSDSEYTIFERDTPEPSTPSASDKKSALGYVGCDPDSSSETGVTAYGEWSDEPCGRRTVIKIHDIAFITYVFQILSPTPLTMLQVSGLLIVFIHRSHRFCAFWIRGKSQVKESRYGFLVRRLDTSTITEINLPTGGQGIPLIRSHYDCRLTSF